MHPAARKPHSNLNFDLHRTKAMFHGPWCHSFFTTGLINFCVPEPILRPSVVIEGRVLGRDL
jgi:hypothetical protein